MSDYSLSKEEYEALHNARCKAHALVSSLSKILSPLYAKDLHDISDLLNHGLARIDQKVEEEEAASYIAAEEIGKKAGIKIARWSAGQVNFEEVPFPGVKVMVYDAHHKIVTVNIPNNGRWIDLWKAADEAILLSGDDHHIFVESFKQISPTEIELGTGS